MASTATRGQIVLDALSLAGRSTELKSSCNGWLNYFLLHVGLTFRFPELLKIGAPQVLAIGQNTSALPADFGLGMSNQGLIFGDNNKPITEYSFEDFASSNGFPVSSGSVGRPSFYFVDRNASVFHFSSVADQAYSFTPCYYKKPPLLATDSSGDNSTVWLDNDIIAVEGLMWFIYKFTNDDREDRQAMKVEKMLNDWKREAVKMGGTSRVMLSPNKFRTIKFGGMNGP